MNELTVPEGTPETLEHLTTGIPKKRDLVINRPGNINYAGERGSFPGCRLIEFTGYGKVKGLEAADAAKFEQQRAEATLDPAPTTSELVNLYFKHRGNMLTVAYDVDASGAAWFLVTNQLEGEELEAFHYISGKISAYMEEFKERKAHELELANEEKRKADLLVAELVELGRKEKAGNFIERARKAEDTVEKLSKENLRLRKKLEK